jgi:hypothetical protein
MTTSLQAYMDGYMDKRAADGAPSMRNPPVFTPRGAKSGPPSVLGGYRMEPQPDELVDQLPPRYGKPYTRDDVLLAAGMQYRKPVTTTYGSLLRGKYPDEAAFQRAVSEASAYRRDNPERFAYLHPDYRTEDGIRRHLETPVDVTVDPRHDEGSLAHAIGSRGQHSSSRTPAKGALASALEMARGGPFSKGVQKRPWMGLVDVDDIPGSDSGYLLHEAGHGTHGYHPDTRLIHGFVEPTYDETGYFVNPKEEEAEGGTLAAAMRSAGIPLTPENIGAVLRSRHMADAESQRPFISALDERADISRRYSNAFIHELFAERDLENARKEAGKASGGLLGRWRRDVAQSSKLKETDAVRARDQAARAVRELQDKMRNMPVPEPTGEALPRLWRLPDDGQGVDRVIERLPGYIRNTAPDDETGRLAGIDPKEVYSAATRRAMNA